MKSFYFAFIAILLVAMTIGSLQAQTPFSEVPVIRSQKTNEPFVRIGVGVSLWKLLGKKKAKALPQQPKRPTLRDLPECHAAISSTIETLILPSSVPGLKDKLIQQWDNNKGASRKKKGEMALTK